MRDRVSVTVFFQGNGPFSVSKPEKFSGQQAHVTQGALRARQSVSFDNFSAVKVLHYWEHDPAPGCVERTWSAAFVCSWTWTTSSSHMHEHCAVLCGQRADMSAVLFLIYLSCDNRNMSQLDTCVRLKVVRARAECAAPQAHQSACHFSGKSAVLSVDRRHHKARSERGLSLYYAKGKALEPWAWAHSPAAGQAPLSAYQYHIIL